MTSPTPATDPLGTAAERSLGGGWLVVSTVMLSLGAAGVFAAIISSLTLSFGSTAVEAGNLQPLVWYWAAAGTAWVALGALAATLATKRSQWVGSAGWVAAGVIMLGALGLRLVVVFSTSPTLSPDIWRYIHDGANTARGENPYRLPPAAYDRSDAPQPEVLSLVDHRQLQTIYLPTSQWVFAGAWTLRETAVDSLGLDRAAWRGDRVFRLTFSLIDVLLIGLILLHLRLEGRSPWWACLYAWHPLVLTEVAWSGHQDVTGTVLLAGALLLASAGSRRAVRAAGLPQWKVMEAARTRSGGGRWGVWAAAGGCFGLAGAVKPFVVPIAVIFAWRMRRQPTAVLIATGAALVAGAGVALPFWLMPTGFDGLLRTSRTFAEHWAFFSPVHGPAVELVGKTTATLLSILLVCGVLMVLLVRRSDLHRSAHWLLLVTLLASSTCYPWYLLWALWLMPSRFLLSTWVYSFTTLLSYHVLTHTADWRVSTAVVVGAYVPVGCALLIDLARAVHGGSGEAEDEVEASARASARVGG